ncbi:MAG: LysM peptidoglycan-binding domain-containing protein, partial [Draconibacterium sp.]|nr:LysM peptidoglycan-binding domain-containing protein [Draconibacterium sp.]
FQGVLNGLMIDRLVDERFDVYKSTEAALNQIEKNREFYNSVEMAVIGFLIGNTRLKNVLDRCKECTNQEVVNLLPELNETIAMYQALSVFFNLNSCMFEKDKLLSDTILINRQLHFKQISNVLNISEDELKFLNPQFRYSIVPIDKENVAVRVPFGKRDDFVIWQDSIYNSYDSSLFQVVEQKIEYPPSPNRQYIGEKVKDLEIEGKTKIRYTIKTGDVLGFIAEEYDVRVADLKYWNNIYNERRIQAGQKLDIFVDDEKAEYYKGLQNAAEMKTSSANLSKKITESLNSIYRISDSHRKVEHIVKNGESPYLIAKKYDGVTPEAILEWNNIEDARKIQVGQKLIIYLTQ